ncbi:Uma2 family endonuclease [Dolichospermum circinale]|jgi:Uma2 family endonuclease|uniref:Uma2 family endonuclease n=1 Tax=Dolichospermum circinale TaxID=109265 RepID=UPI0023311883|nr:Uma2 family endonuclease [Dolichospermum circinale]MDB9449943.1 Uma2 family endonuclease [Dolichospermum circinale CS-547]
MLETVLAEPSIKLPPTQAELPCDDGIPMETQRHKFQMDILIDTIQPWLEQRTDGYVGGNMFVYYSLAQLKNQDFRGPDFFAVLGVPKTERLSWVVWEEGKPPDVVIELLSESTANNDKNQKKLIYQNQMRVSEYFWYDPFNPNDFAGFDLNSGAYQRIALNEKNQLVSKVLDLALVRWEGNYRGVDATWLRWATLDGELFPTSQEMVIITQQRADEIEQIAEQEKQRAEQEKQRAEQAELQLRQVAIKLLQNGMSIEQVAQLTNLDILEVEQLMN